MSENEYSQLSVHTAQKFVDKWKTATSEKSDGQSFWRDFFIEVCELTNLKDEGIEFERPVISSKKGNTNFIDVFWKDTLLVEQKSLGKNLDEAEIQARGYLVSLPPALRPPVLVVSDFSKIRIIEYLLDQSIEFPLEDLPKNLQRFEAIINKRIKNVATVEIEADQKASRLMANLYKELEKNGYEGHEASVFMVRILFCLFADDTRMWRSGLFSQFLKDTSPDGKDTGARIQSLFELLNTEIEKRPKVPDKLLTEFPYVNGGLFSERLSTFFFTPEMRKALLDSCAYDWSSINPTIFGALFQDIKSKEERRALGEHYTTEQAIDKALYPLFLDELNEKVIEAWDNPAKLKSIKRSLGDIKIIDPACGSGNFLITSYKRLRRLELEIIQRIKQLEGTSNQVGLLDATLEIDVKLEQIYGIEIEEWSSQIATVALFLTDHQENLKLETVLGYAPDKFPLRHSAKIVHGNSLEINWQDVCRVDDFTKVVGNPPFLGSTYQSKEQKSETAKIWGKATGSGVIDYVANWHLLAARYISGTKAKVAFVSTNSITQGEQPQILWTELYQLNMEIDFAHRTFVWESDASGKANVHCVIIGFSQKTNSRKLRLWDYDSDNVSSVSFPKNINGYLLDAPNVLISPRRKPIQKFTIEMVNGSKPADGGFLSNISPEEANEIRKSDPVASKYLKRIIGAQELLNGKERFCLWLVGADPNDIKTSKVISSRVAEVRAMREASADKTTKADADKPTLFQKIRQPKTDYLAIPATSSSNRNYVPIAYETTETIVTNALLTIPESDLETFAILQSKVFAVWNDAVSGRLKSDYRISAEITYNNFPFLNLNIEQRNKLKETAQGILNAREEFPGSSLAVLYDKNAMPPALRAAHNENDKAVLNFYELKNNSTNLEILKRLFELYSELASSAN